MNTYKTRKLGEFFPFPKALDKFHFNLLFLEVLRLEVEEWLHRQTVHPGTLPPSNLNKTVNKR